MPLAAGKGLNPFIIACSTYAVCGDVGICSSRTVGRCALCVGEKAGGPDLRCRVGVLQLRRTPVKDMVMASCTE